jgi:hypothetical protein
MTRVVRVAKMPELVGGAKYYAGLFGEEMVALMKAFRVTDGTAARMAKGGFTSFFDLANLCDLDGFLLYQNSVLQELYQCAENSAQTQVLSLMMTRFGYLIREAGGFDLGKPEGIYDVDLPKLTEVTTAFNDSEKRKGGSGGKGVLNPPAEEASTKKEEKKGGRVKGKTAATVAATAMEPLSGGSAEPQPSTSGVENVQGSMGKKRKRDDEEVDTESDSDTDTEDEKAADVEKVKSMIMSYFSSISLTTYLNIFTAGG